MKEKWTYKKLGEVGSIITGSTPSTKDEENYSSNDYCFVKPSDISKDGISIIEETEFHVSKKGFDSSRKLPKGSVLTTCIGIIGKVGILQKDAICNQQINAIIPSSVIDSKFLALAIYSIRNEMEIMANAPVVPIINKTDFSNFKIPVPPIETQSRIVSELDLLQFIIDKQKAQLKELDNLAQAVFYDMFGDPVENEKGWEVKKLGEVCTFLQGEQVPIEEQFFEKKDGTIRFLRIVDFTQGNEEPRYVYCKDERHILHDNEIAIVRYGTPGFVCYGKFGLIANNLFKVVPKNINFFDFRYLVSWLESSAFQSTVQDNQYGAALQAIKFGTIQNIIIIMPPLSLQQSFATKIESIEKQKAAINQSIAETQRLFDYTMDKYFG